MKRILVPTDFSECANNAAEVAMQIAKKVNAEIGFLHVFITPIDWVNLDIRKEKRYPEVKKKINNAKTELKKLKTTASHLGLISDEILTFRQGMSSIAEYAQNLNYDLIVMGSHGARGLRETIIGSNAQRLVTGASTPVLIIKEKMETFQPENMVFSSTFKEDVYGPFHRIIEFADLMDIYINLLYVNDKAHFEETRKSEVRMKSFLEKCPRGTCSVNVYNDSTAEKGILGYAADRKMDLIAIVTHGSKGLFRSSLTGRLVNHSSLPVLSVNVALKKTTSGKANKINSKT